MTQRQKTPATLEDIARKLDSLFGHLTSLDKSVQTLAGRIEPYDDEDLSKLIPRTIPPIVSKKTASMDAIFEKIRLADNHIEAMERDLSKIRSLLQGMDGSTQLHDELEPFFKRPRKT
ncbi:hypothetical protein [Roseibium polysiphoniae]|uniref:hypothetical protein n=1 Tax=Roseibium polysiphoniae TaxID=2571221 RepID=UPI0032970581